MNKKSLWLFTSLLSAIVAVIQFTLYVSGGSVLWLIAGVIMVVNTFLHGYSYFTGANK